MFVTKRDGAQGAAGKFGERVMGDGFTAIEEEGNAVAMKDAAQWFMRIFHRAHENSGFAKAASGANEFEDFASGEDGFGFGVGAFNDTDLFAVGFECARIAPTFFEMRERYGFIKAAVGLTAREGFFARRCEEDGLEFGPDLAIGARDRTPH